jgi:hypothetical protein
MENKYKAYNRNSIRCRKCRLEEKISELKDKIRPDELEEINKLYDKHIPTTIEDINRIKSYKNFLQSYVDAKYQNRRRQK